jgi:hypothetical protein
MDRIVYSYLVPEVNKASIKLFGPTERASSYFAHFASQDLPQSYLFNEEASPIWLPQLEHFLATLA